MENKISHIVGTNTPVTDKNGNVGLLVKIGYKLEYRFNQCTVVNGEVVSKQTIEEVEKKPIVFCGFVAHLLEKWTYSNDSIFEEYYSEERRKYVRLHDEDDDVFLRDLYQEFSQLHEQQEIALIQKSQGVFDFLNEKQAKLFNDRISEYLDFVRNEAQEKTITQVEELEVELTKELEGKVLENYIFWNKQSDEKQGRENIFKFTKQSDFLQMVGNADFSAINKKGMSQRVQYNVYVLSRVLGKDWGEKAAMKIGAKSLRDCSGKTKFSEHPKLKSMFLK
jgi:hypothetical protein